MLTYALEHRGTDSLYEYLYKCIRNDIETGAIAAHEKLPSKRSLARHLGVSLITVEGAYTQLAAEGYVYAIERKGYFANPLVKNAATPSSRAARQQKAHAQAEESASSALVADFTGSSVATGLFPYGTWAKTVREALAEESERTLLCETSAAGSLRLRRALANHLSGFRGMQVAPDQIVVGSGAQTLYNLIVQLLGRTMRYAVEDPGYARLTQIYRANNVALSHVPMDEGGIEVEKLRRCGADVLHIMPSHQYPTGLVTAISRRYELLGWASEENGRFVIEDDYDCEFRLAGRPIPALQTIDASERVIYTNTFTKSLGPAFRIGYMVLPEHLATRFEQELGFYSCTVSAIDQLALARFIENGDYERHVNRMRTHYRSVRNDLIAAFKATSLADRMSIEAEDSGLHFILGIKSAASEQEIARAAQARGVALAPLSSFYQDAENLPNLPPGTALPRKFVVSYTGIARESIESAAQAIAQAADG